jgi:hypothetical protein
MHVATTKASSRQAYGLMKQGAQIFAFLVDDFGIKYESEEDAQHLIDLLTPF